MAQQNNEEDRVELAQEIAAEQEIYRAQKELEALRVEGQTFSHPSYFKYGLLFFIAIIVDIVDFVQFTGIGYVISVIVSLLGTAIILLTLWITDAQQKRAVNYSSNLEVRITAIQARISQATRMALKTSRMLRKVPGMRRVARAIPRTLVRIRRFARKNPLTKVFIGGIANLIPIFGALNLMVIWIYLAYRDEKKTYTQAREASEETI